jgi:hypothetical protein
MAQFHDYVWWRDQFKGIMLQAKGKMRPAKSEDEAREFVAFYEKRGGGCRHWKIPMQKAFNECYGKPYMNPAEYKVYMLEQRAKELEEQIKAKEAEVGAGAAAASGDGILTRDQHKEKWAAEHNGSLQGEAVTWSNYAKKHGIGA